MSNTQEINPASTAFSVTPSDTASFFPVRGLYIGSTGNLSVETADGQSAIIFASVPAGTIIPVRATRVNSTGTTASSIVGLR